MTNKKHYRLYVVHKVPQIRVLDFQKVKLKVGGRRPRVRTASALPGGIVLALGLADVPSPLTASACGRRNARRRRKCSKANAALSWRRISPSRAKRKGVASVPGGRAGRRSSYLTGEQILRRIRRGGKPAERARPSNVGSGRPQVHARIGVAAGEEEDGSVAR